MKKKLIALIGALVILLTFFTACGNNTGTQQGDKPQANDPQLVIAANPVFVYDDGTTAVAYNDVNVAMGKDSKASTLSAIADSDWSWARAENDEWTRGAVYGFARWKSGAGAQAKGVYAYSYNAASSISLGLYNAQSNELVTYQDEEIPQVGVLLSAVKGKEEALVYTVPQDGTITIPAGTFTAIEQVAGVKTGFLAEDGTARSASVRILVNSAQVYSGTLCNSTAAEDGAAVTQLSNPQINDLPVKAGDTIIFALKLEAQANSDKDVTQPTVNEEDNWQIVKASRTVVDDSDKGGKNESDVTAADGSIMMIMDYQFTFSLVREDAYATMANDFATTIMKRTAAEVFTTKAGGEDKYEIVIGVHSARPTSAAIQKEIQGARADNADDYIIRMVGTKLYIVGANDQALQKALNYFLDTFVQDDSGKIAAKYNYYYKPDHVMYTLAGQNIASYVIRTEHYPSLVVQRAAEAVQEQVLNDCGYIIPIKPMNYEGTDAGNNEIRIGPMNGAVKVERKYDNRFNSSNWENYYISFGTDGMLTGVDDGYYKASFDGKCVEIEGGSSYAVNVGTVKFLADLKKAKTLATTYTTSGNYESYYDYELMYEYEKVDFSMTDGFGLTYSEDFNYTGTNKEKEKSFRTKWWVMTDSTDSTNQDGDQDMYQYRPGVYGDNWWVAADTAGNNYLFEITKKRTQQYEGSDHGWDSVRMSSEGYWGFRYGIWETRIVMGTRNGSCSAIWAGIGLPYQRVGPHFELDLYENYGRDIFVPCTHHSQDGVYVGNYQFQEPFYQEKCWLEPNDGEHFYDTFHHATVDWSYDHLDIYFDGQCVSAMPMFNNADFKYYRTGLIIKLANGVGTKYYCNMNEQGKHNKLPAHIPEYWMSQYGGDINDFFEVQLIDYTRIYQTNNDTIEYKQAENEMKFTASFGKN